MHRLVTSTKALAHMRFWSFMVGLFIVTAFTGCGESRTISKEEYEASVLKDLVKQLRDPDPARRASAAMSLGEMKERAAPAIPALLETLEDRTQLYLQSEVNGFVGGYAETSPANEAVKALTKIGPPVVEPLIARMNATISGSSKDIGIDHLCDAGARVLGEIRDPRAVDILIACLWTENGKSTDYDSEKRQKEYRDDIANEWRSRRKRYGDQWRDNDNNERLMNLAAVEVALVKIGKPAVDALISARNDKNPRVRTSVEWTLEMIKESLAPGPSTEASPRKDAQQNVAGEPR